MFKEKRHAAAMKELDQLHKRMCYTLTEFCQPLQVQIHLEMLRILVQLGHTQRT